MKPEFYKAYAAWLESFLYHYDFIILAAVVGVLALIGLAAVCYLYIVTAFDVISKE